MFIQFKCPNLFFSLMVIFLPLRILLVSAIKIMSSYVYLKVLSFFESDSIYNINKDPTIILASRLILHISVAFGKSR